MAFLGPCLEACSVIWIFPEVWILSSWTISWWGMYTFVCYKITLVTLGTKINFGSCGWDLAVSMKNWCEPVIPIGMEPARTNLVHPDKKGMSSSGLTDLSGQVVLKCVTIWRSYGGSLGRYFQWKDSWRNPSWIRTMTRKAFGWIPTFFLCAAGLNYRSHFQ